MFRRISLQRKGFLILACLGLITHEAVSQQKTAPPQPKKFRMGFKASPNFSWMHGLSDEVKSDGAGIGFSYGLMAENNFTDNYAIAAEVLVSSMGISMAHQDTLIYYQNGLGQRYSEVSFDYKLQYVQLPVSLKLKTNEIGKFVWYGQFGFAPSFLINNSVRTLSNPVFVGKKYSPNSTDNDFNGQGGKGVFKDDVSVLRFSMIIGAGIEYRISGNTMLNIGLRFDNGLNDFLRDKAAIGRSNFMALNLGVFF
ncbi:MAG: outer membrane beta-barrel protein [Bacteroidetes bacterium]|nr:outer membrane beta-barrel protein [Bacteroidota bacterium]